MVEKSEMAVRRVLVFNEHARCAHARTKSHKIPQRAKNLKCKNFKTNCTLDIAL